MHAHEFSRKLQAAAISVMLFRSKRLLEAPCKKRRASRNIRSGATATEVVHYADVNAPVMGSFLSSILPFCAAGKKQIHLGLRRGC